MFNHKKIIAILGLILVSSVSYADSKCDGRQVGVQIQNSTSSSVTLTPSPTNGSYAITGGTSEENPLPPNQTIIYTFTADGNGDLKIGVGSGFIEASLTSLGLSCLTSTDNGNANGINIKYTAKLEGSHDIYAFTLEPN